MKSKYDLRGYWLVPTTSTMCSASFDASFLIFSIISGYLSITGGSASTGTVDTLLVTEISKLGIFLGSTFWPLAFGRKGLFQQAVRGNRN